MIIKLDDAPVQQLSIIGRPVVVLAPPHAPYPRRARRDVDRPRRVLRVRQPHIIGRAVREVGLEGVVALLLALPRVRVEDARLFPEDVALHAARRVDRALELVGRARFGGRRRPPAEGVALVRVHVEFAAGLDGAHEARLGADPVELAGLGVGVLEDEAERLVLFRLVDEARPLVGRVRVGGFGADERGCGYDEGPKHLSSIALSLPASSHRYLPKYRLCWNWPNKAASKLIAKFLT